MKRAAVALACLWACGVRAQAVPWDATYNPATRQTKISVTQTIPKATPAANSPWGFSTAANGDVYAKATGKIPGPLGAATTTAGATVARSLAARALGIAAKSIPIVAAAGAIWELCKELGASIGSNGEPAVWLPEGSYVYNWTSYDVAGVGGQELTMGGAVGAIGSRYTGCPRFTSDGTCYTGVRRVQPGQTGNQINVQVQTRGDRWESIEGMGWVKTNTGDLGWKDAGRVMPSAVTNEVEKPFDLGTALGGNADVPIAPAVQQAVDAVPVPLSIPSMRPEPEAMPLPQATPWQATQADPAKQERAVYTPVWSEKEQAIQWNKTNEVKDAAGQITSTPEAAPVGNSGAAGEGGVDICEEHPEILACQELGEPEEGDDLPRKDKNVNGITPWGSFGPSSGSCPNYSAAFMGQTIAIDLKLVCDGLTWMRPAVIGLAWIMAAYIFIGGIKQGD